MSKLAYSDEVDNGGEGWQEDFPEDLTDINLAETVASLPEPPAESESDAQETMESEMARSDIPNEATLESLSTVDSRAPDVVGEPSYNEEEQHQPPPDVQNNDVSVEPPPSPPPAAASVSDLVGSTRSHQDEAPPPPPLMFPKQTASALSTFSPDLTSALPVVEPKAEVEPPPPPHQHPHQPVVHQSPVPVPKQQEPSKIVSSLGRSTAAPATASPIATTLPALPVAATNTATAHPVEQNAAARKTLLFPQTQIKYRQPMDYTALLNNVKSAAAINRVNQPTPVAGLTSKQPQTAPLVGGEEQKAARSAQLAAPGSAALAATQQSVANILRQSANPPKSTITSAQITSAMTYPQPSSVPSALNRNGTLPGAPKPSEPAHVHSQPNQQQPLVRQTHQQQQPPPPQQQQQQVPLQSNNFSRSQTLPDIAGVDSQLPQQPQYYQQQQQPGFYGSTPYVATNGDGYMSEHDDSTAKASNRPSVGGSEERKSKKRHKGRHSHQPPPVDPYQMGYFTENPQSYADYYRQWYEQQARMYGSYSGASTPAAYDPSESGSEYDSQSRPSSRMSVSGNYVSPQVNNPYAYYQQYQAAAAGTGAGAGGYDQAAAWWYWYYMQQQQMQVQQQTPQRPSTPKKFAYPHCRATFSASGFLVSVLPGRSYATAGPGSAATRVSIIRTVDAIKPAFPDESEYTSFPGPLVPNESHKIDVINFTQRMSQQAMASDYVDRDSVNLLWRFIELLVRQNGTYYGADVSHLLTEALPALPEQLTESADQAIQAAGGSISQLRDFLLHGRKREAVDYAMSKNLWAHAMFLSHSMNERDFISVRNRFLAASAAPGDPLATFYQLTTLSSPVISRQAVTSDMHSWRQHLAVILSNTAASAQFQRQLLLSLGDTLRAQGRLYAAQLCYLMAGDQFSNFPPTSTSSDGFAPSTRMILLGTEPSASFLNMAKPYFCQLTEIYEYCLRLANPRSVLPAFQLFKAFYCMCLAEMGLVHEAFRYLISIIEGLQISFNVHPSAASTFPRVCFKWLCDLYTALHKAEPAVDYDNTINWIFIAAQGGPIQPPPLQGGMMQQQQQPQQYGFGSGRSDDYRNMSQTPGPYGGAINNQSHHGSLASQDQHHHPFAGSGQSQGSTSMFNHPPALSGQTSLMPPQAPVATSTPGHNAADLPFGRSYGSGGPSMPGAPGAADRPFAQSGRFAASMSRRSDGGSDQPGFGSSIESITSINNIMNDVRRAAMNYSGDGQNDHSMLQSQRSMETSAPTPQPHLNIAHTTSSQSNYAPDDNQHQQNYQQQQHQQQQQQQPPQQQEPPQSYVSPFPSWQPQIAPSSQPANDYSSQYRQQDSISNNRDVSPTPPPQSLNDTSPSKKDGNKTGTPSGGLLASVMSKLPFGSGSGSNSKPGPKKVVLPDDSKKTIVWDEAKGRWIDTTNKDGDDTVEDLPPPPPPMMAPAVNTVATTSQPPMLGGGLPAMSAPGMSALGPRPRGRYVDVLKPSAAPDNSSGPAGAPGAPALLRPSLYAAPPTARMFVPPSVPDPS